ncbi:G5 domain-containing protein [Candidatus Saccharibacteria bacterium]|nr:G5 domain-containing protein [Candidatus Saccharibacteria bacterium]
MRIKSEKLVILAGFLLIAVFFVLGMKLAPASFADNEDTAEDVEYLASGPDHFVTVHDNGVKKTVKTDAATVGEVLDRLKIELDPTDSVSPSLDTAVDADQYFINIYRSHPVLIFDGINSTLAQVTSYEPYAVARAAGFTVYDDDTVALIPTTAFLEAGVSSAYQISRGSGTQLTVEEDIEFATETIRDYNIETGKEEVRQLGELGKVQKVYKVKSIDGQEVSRELVSETVLREPVKRIVAVGTAIQNATPLTAGMGRNRYTAKDLQGNYVERQETYYDLNMSGVMGFCGKSGYTVREDGAKVDDEGYIIVAANLTRYPRCSVVETSLGLGKVYDTGTFAATNPEQFDLATDWTRRDGI